MENVRWKDRFGKTNPAREYLMNLGEHLAPHIIESTLIERDLGINLTNDLKWASQTEKTVKAELLLNSETASPILMQN